MDLNNKKIYTKVGENIRNKRKEMKISQTTLGRQIGGCTRQCMSAYEIGKNVLNLDVFIKICNALNCSADELLGDLIKINNTNMNCPNYKKLLERNRKIIDIISCALYEQEINNLKKL